MEGEGERGMGGWGWRVEGERVMGDEGERGMGGEGERGMGDEGERGRRPSGWPGPAGSIGLLGCGNYPAVDSLLEALRSNIAC